MNRHCQQSQLIKVLQGSDIQASMEAAAAAFSEDVF